MTSDMPPDGLSEGTEQPRNPEEQSTEEQSTVEKATQAETPAGVPKDFEAEAERAGAGVGGAVRAAAEAAPGPGPLAAPAINFASELGSIDFRKMIGGPLQAAVDAQVASSLATVNFINAVGFTSPDGKRELVMVDFSHTRAEVDAQGTETKKDVAVRVPLLAMLQIPSLRIEQVVVNFNVKLNSVETAAVSTKFDVGGELSIGWGPVNFKVSASYQRKTTTNVEVKREYALTVNVKAVQDEIPAGLDKVLGILAA
jgi:hypothetical protein